MDQLDERILAILVEDGRASFSGIGREVGLSTNAVAARVRRLERAGVIVGYRAVLGVDAPAGATGAIEAFIDVRLRADRDSEEFLEWARALSAVTDAAHVTGPYDYHLHIRVPDMAALDMLLRSLKKEGGAEQTHTRIALR
ncbi:Lrp/AsnC family transcriptional regulator [Microbacterium immunditiarum]|uniref:Lrp/AsnC family leucine-responsive transcriptional regulator n=1 Tax=Microbacterium immunditiarum TaxID=337480 RepID=A0A7Y9GL19_9MICO|nr:Lrp/AsnC family transcriptional regulator [Microbacterium immunditiarum]NYE18478.1 Lrp/AsnC family leucine-responsive transcriptional regulator [Microbacterium immunditiarum]